MTFNNLEYPNEPDQEDPEFCKVCCAPNWGHVRHLGKGIGTCVGRRMIPRLQQDFRRRRQPAITAPSPLPPSPPSLQVTPSPDLAPDVVAPLDVSSQGSNQLVAVSHSTAVTTAALQPGAEASADDPGELPLATDQLADDDKGFRSALSDELPGPQRCSMQPVSPERLSTGEDVSPLLELLNSSTVRPTHQAMMRGSTCF